MKDLVYYEKRRTVRVQKLKAQMAAEFEKIVIELCEEEPTERCKFNSDVLFLKKLTPNIILK